MLLAWQKICRKSPNRGVCRLARLLNEINMVHMHEETSKHKKYCMRSVLYRLHRACSYQVCDRRSACSIILGYNF